MMDIDKAEELMDQIAKQRDDLYVLLVKTEKERDEALAKLATMEHAVNVSNQHLECYRKTYGSAPADTPAVAVPDDCYELMSDLAAALYACVNAGKVNEADIINQNGNRIEIGDLLDLAESAIVTRNSFAAGPSHSQQTEAPDWATHTWAAIVFCDGKWYGVRDGWEFRPRYDYKGFPTFDLLKEDGEFLCYGTFNGNWEESYTRRPTSHSQQSAKRITEQDAREIGASVFSYCRKRLAENWSLDIWLSEHGGSPLLEKLNADRFPSHESEQ